MKFQLISFEDHFSENETWVDPEKYKPKPVILQYCGWVIFEDDKFVVLSQGRDVDVSFQEYDSHMHILKNCITKRKTIKID